MQMEVPATEPIKTTPQTNHDEFLPSPPTQKAREEVAPVPATESVAVEVADTPVVEVATTLGAQLAPSFECVSPASVTLSGEANSPIVTATTAEDSGKSLSEGEVAPVVEAEAAPNVELFVGDLSFFCVESHLLELFRPFGTIVDARVRRSDNKGHSLMYGFVKMENLTEAENAARALNDRLYMGRTLRVQVCTLDGAAMAKVPRPGTHVHVTFVTEYSDNNLVTEEKLRAIFETYGEISDVIVKRHTMTQDPPKQNGYGFVYFVVKESAERAVEHLNNQTVDNIRFECELSHRSTGSGGGRGGGAGSGAGGGGDQTERGGARARSNSSMSATVSLGGDSRTGRGNNTPRGNNQSTSTASHHAVMHGPPPSGPPASFGAAPSTTSRNAPSRTASRISLSLRSQAASTMKPDSPRQSNNNRSNAYSPQASGNVFNTGSFSTTASNNHYDHHSSNGNSNNTSGKVSASVSEGQQQYRGLDRSPRGASNTPAGPPAQQQQTGATSSGSGSGSAGYPSPLIYAVSPQATNQVLMLPVQAVAPMGSYLPPPNAGPNNRGHPGQPQMVPYWGAPPNGHAPPTLHTLYSQPGVNGSTQWVIAPTHSPPTPSAHSPHQTYGTPPDMSPPMGFTTPNLSFLSSPVLPYGSPPFFAYVPQHQPPPQPQHQPAPLQPPSPVTGHKGLPSPNQHGQTQHSQPSPSVSHSSTGSSPAGTTASPSTNSTNNAGMFQYNNRPVNSSGVNGNANSSNSNNGSANVNIHVNSSNNINSSSNNNHVHNNNSVVGGNSSSGSGRRPINPSVQFDGRTSNNHAAGVAPLSDPFMPPFYQSHMQQPPSYQQHHQQPPQNNNMHQQQIHHTHQGPTPQQQPPHMHYAHQQQPMHNMHLQQQQNVQQHHVAYENGNGHFAHRSHPSQN